MDATNPSLLWDFSLRTMISKTDRFVFRMYYYMMMKCDVIEKRLTLDMEKSIDLAALSLQGNYFSLMQCFLDHTELFENEKFTYFTV